MASKRPNPASHSDPRPDIPIGGRVERHPATTASGEPGTLRVVVGDSAKGTEIVGEDALKRLPTLCGKAEAGDLGRPDRPDARPGAGGRRQRSSSTR